MVHLRAIARTRTNIQCTHFLRIPLLGWVSSPQLQSSFQRFVQDPLTAQIPRVGMRSLEMLQLNMAALSLPTPDHLDTAWNLLNRLSHNDWEVTLRDCRTANGIQGTLMPSGFSSPASGSSGTIIKSQKTRSPFFMVDMVGLNDGSGYTARSLNPAAVMKFFVPLLDRTSTLVKFSDTVVKEFIAAGLLLPDQPPLRNTPMMTNVVKTVNVVFDDPPQMSSRTDKKTGSLLWKRPQAMRFDARPVLASYNDYVWAKDIPLERLCISDTKIKGTMDTDTFEGRWYPDSMSVPLPGVSDSMQARRFS